MKIDIYKSIKDGSNYLSVPKGTKVESPHMLDPVDPDLLTLSPFRTRLELTAGKTHTALDQDNIIDQIERNGYAVHGAKIEIRLKGSTG